MPDFLLEHFQWLTEAQSRDLAPDKLAMNALRYPVAKEGNSRKHDEL